MKKIVMITVMAFTMITGLFAEVKLYPRDKFNKLVSAFEDSLLEPQIAYVADTWDDVYEKTGVGKHGWKYGGSMYCNNETDQYFLIVEFSFKDSSDLMWVCCEFPGDGTLTEYAADVVYWR